MAAQVCKIHSDVRVPPNFVSRESEDKTVEWSVLTGKGLYALQIGQKILEVVINFVIYRIFVFQDPGQRSCLA